MDEKYIDALKALSEPNRLRLFWLLLHVDKRMAVAEAMDVIGDTQYNISRNLKMLYRAGLLEHHKKGKWVYYSLKAQCAPHCKALVDSVRHLPKEDFQQVMEHCILRLSLRENGECVLGADSAQWHEKIR
ncbi:ArsR/SmtB family transcription factor [Shewanella intestini]|uniref:Winged helix-turn-helix transcriptional regulator n=1 Tax=Shewanella intestini TaxID=2017544 RepID=A0ABS5HZE4_9GAMM|nr:MULTISPECIES: metalloregulator ArsR/SmtB family transcription factor [Shewanella]MBR9727155.1 winged helix-turn-helix transcriptional regulator [Shewanella intestini]MRG35957.1 metalloregulator ArsR/SmtB family transcription factor [Shewanella sp. XMDDZSB0408]